ncbi:MAG: hypothetical protein M1582_02825 [Actinobacteria bacterium]|nr:hypothetical protein [Actinomycetota bacterium]
MLPDHVAADQESEGLKAHLVEHRISVRHLAVWCKRVGRLMHEAIHNHPATIVAELHAAPAYWRPQDKIERRSWERWRSSRRVASILCRRNRTVPGRWQTGSARMGLTPLLA